MLATAADYRDAVIIEAFFERLPAPARAVRCRPRGRRSVCLDYVSRPDAFTRLYPKLLDGYLLDALTPAEEASADSGIEAFLSAVGKARRSRQPSVALGDDLRLRGDGVVGSGLELDGEIVQLSAFTS